MCVQRSLHANSARRRSNGGSERDLLRPTVASRSTFHQTTAHQLLQPRQLTELAHAAPPTRGMCAPCGAWQPGERHRLTAALGRGDPSPLKWTDQSGIHHQLDPIEQWQAFSHNLQALPSCTFGTKRSKSRTNTLVATRAPASRKIRAPTLSTANPRLPNTPARLHAARWWPKESRRRPHRQVRETRGRGRRK